MKQLLILLFLTALISCKRENDLLQYKKQFDQELKPWTNSFYHFNLANFKKGKSLPFENGLPQNFASYKEFISTNKTILSFPPDSSKFIDLYTTWVRPIQIGDPYEVSPHNGGAILLCDPATKYWDRIWYYLPGKWIDEVTWVSKTTFILAGITQPSPDTSEPYILIGDTEKKTLDEYLNTNPQCLQPMLYYRSSMLKRVKKEKL
jgi:hypothetical protein